MARIDANLNDPQQDIEPIERLSKDALKALMDSNDQIKKLLQALAKTYGVQVEELPIDQDLADELPWLVDNFSVIKPWLSKKTTLSSKNEIGKQYQVQKDSITFIDNNERFEMRDGHEMALLAKLNPALEGRELYLEGTPQEQYILLLNCQHLGVKVNKKQIKTLEKSLPESEKQSLQNEHARLQKDINQDKAILLVEKRLNDFTRAQEIIDTLQNSSLSDFEKNYNIARKTNNALLSKITDAEQILEKEKDNLTDYTTASNNLKKIKQDLIAHQVILDDLEQHIEPAKTSLSLHSTADTAANRLGKALRDATVQTENIDIALRKGRLDEAEALLSTIDGKIETARNVIQPARDALTLLIRNAKASQLPDFLQKDLIKSVRSERDVVRQHQMAVEGEDYIPSLEAQIPLLRNSFAFKQDWQAAETNFKALEADVNPKWFQRLRSGTLRSVIKNLEAHTQKVSAENFSVESESDRQDLLDKTTALHEKISGTTDKDGKPLLVAYVTASRLIDKAQKIDFPEHTTSQLTDISFRVEAVRNIFKKHALNRDEAIASIKAAPETPNRTANNSGGGQPAPAGV